MRQIPPDVVRLGSKVTYKRDGAEPQEVSLVLPAAADISAGKVSVLTPIGTALIGLSTGQTLTWAARDGQLHRLQVLAVEQPAAAEEYAASTWCCRVPARAPDQRSVPATEQQPEPAACLSAAPAGVQPCAMTIVAASPRETSTSSKPCPPSEVGGTIRSCPCCASSCRECSFCRPTRSRPPP